MKKIAVLLLAALLVVGALMPMPSASADADKFTLERITDFDLLGTDFGDIGDYEEAEKQIAADLGDLFHTKDVYCVTGKSDADVYFCDVYYSDSPELWEWAQDPIMGADLKSYIENGTYFVYAVRPVPDPVPETGDSTPVALMAGLLLLSGAALITLRKRTAK